MTGKTVTIARDGSVVVTKTSDDGTGPQAATAEPGFAVGVHSNKPLDPASFIAGLMLGALLYFIVQSAMRWHARREARGHARAAAIGPQVEDRMAAEVAALARRTATLETIVTDPAQRTAREIEALR